MYRSSDTVYGSSLLVRANPTIEPAVWMEPHDLTILSADVGALSTIKKSECEVPPQHREEYVVLGLELRDMRTRSKDVESTMCHDMRTCRSKLVSSEASIEYE